MSKLKKISIITLVVLLALWFGGNLGFYLYLKYKVIGSENIKLINNIPEKIELKESDLEADYICFSDIRLRFPFYKEGTLRIGNVLNYTPEQNIFLSIISSVESDIYYGTYTLKIDNFHKHKYEHPSIAKKSVSQELKEILFYGDYSSRPLNEFLFAMHNSSLSDYSWWNLFKNFKLYELLHEKFMYYFDPPFKFKYYRIQTPEITGILSELKRVIRDIKRASYFFDFAVNDKSYSFSFFMRDEYDDGIELVNDIISSIEINVNPDECYKEMKKQYENNDESNYPKDLLLLSMISIEEPTIENIQMLKQSMEESERYSDNYINKYQEIIDILKSRED